MKKARAFLTSLHTHRYIRKQILLNGMTGKVAFDDNGDRIYAEYDIINVKETNLKYPVGQYYFNSVIFTIVA